MRAARLKEGKDYLDVEEVDVPEPRANEIVVEVEAASICGSDIHHLAGELPIDPERRPVTLGHEGAGTVTKAGDGVTHFGRGDRVIVNYVISCGHCEPCLRGWDNRCRHRRSVGSDVDGTFAEYVVVPARSALRMPESIPFTWGSIAGCAVSTAYHAVNRSDLGTSDVVVVFGTGGVGLHVVLFASSLLPERVIAVDPVESRRTLARKYGADAVIDPVEEDTVERVREETGRWAADVAFECSGTAEAMQATVEAIDGDNKFESGTAVSVGAQVESIDVEYWGIREGQVMVSGDHTRAELQEVIDLVEAQKLDLSGSVGARIDLAAINEAIARAENDESLAGKLIVDP